jgi:hypothetical protein
MPLCVLLLTWGVCLQAGQYIKMKLVEDSVFPRLGFWVQGAPTPGLQEQVRGMCARQ